MTADYRYEVRRRMAVFAVLTCFAALRESLPAAEPMWVFREQTRDGRRIVALEAEHCSARDVGQLALVAHASGGQVLFCPDEVRAHRGQVTVASYRIQIQTPGRWYVRLRVFAAHHIQNGVHLHWDGRRLVDPDGGDGAILLPKNGWGWSLRWQGEGNTDLVYVDVERPGEHALSIIRREPMTYYDKILLLHQDDRLPARNDLGADETVACAGAEGSGPPSYGLHGIEDFPYDGSGFERDRHGPQDRAAYLTTVEGVARAAVAMPFAGKSGRYGVRLEYLPPREVACEFLLRVGGRTVGAFRAAPDPAEQEPANFYVQDVPIDNGQAIEVVAIAPDGARARWRRVFLYGGPFLPYATE